MVQWALATLRRELQSAFRRRRQYALPYCAVSGMENAGRGRATAERGQAWRCHGHGQDRSLPRRSVRHHTTPGAGSHTHGAPSNRLRSLTPFAVTPTGRVLCSPADSGKSQPLKSGVSPSPLGSRQGREPECSGRTARLLQHSHTVACGPFLTNRDDVSNTAVGWDF